MSNNDKRAAIEEPEESPAEKKRKQDSLEDKLSVLFFKDEPDYEFLKSLIADIEFTDDTLTDFDSMDQAHWRGVVFTLSDKAMMPWLVKEGLDKPADSSREYLLRKWVIRNMRRNASDLVPLELSKVAFNAMYDSAEKFYCCVGKTSLPAKMTNEELHKAGYRPWEIVAANTSEFHHQ